MEKAGKDGKRTSSRPGVEGKPEGNADVRQGIEQLLAYINQRTSRGYVSTGLYYKMLPTKNLATAMFEVVRATR